MNRAGLWPAIDAREAPPLPLDERHHRVLSGPRRDLVAGSQDGTRGKRTSRPGRSISDVPHPGESSMDSGYASGGSLVPPVLVLTGPTLAGPVVN
jgi:hypothetical protein